MKKAELASGLVFVLLVSMSVEVPVTKVANANPYGMFRMGWRDIIVIQSPQNETYNGETLLLNFTVEHLSETSSYLTRYVLQKTDSMWHMRTIVNVTLKRTNATHEYKYATAPIAQYDSHLSNLADGTYNFTVQRYYENPREPEEISVVSSATVIFTIGTARIPEFPSGLILVFILVSGIRFVIFKKAWRPVI